MKLKGIHHWSVVVSDMERAVKFYSEVLGLQEIEIPSTFKPIGAKVRWFRLGDQHIHLMPAPQPDTLSPRHIALEIDDAQAGREYFKERGFTIGDEPLIPGADRFVITDPDGNRIELIEWQEPYHNTPINA
jgi:catechol 2,3-dioxygenase-like lactoylglutathione lyase family enzyme